MAVLGEAHYHLGLVLYDKGRLDEAVAEYREALRLGLEDNAGAHNNLGVALRAKGDLDGAIAQYQRAIRLKADSAEAHTNLGVALVDKGRLDEAIAECREAIRLKKDFAPAHYNLGSALHYKGDFDGAIAAFRAAIRLRSDYDRAYLNLGLVLRDAGQFAEALTYLRRGHELASKGPLRSYPTAQWVKECERLIELEPKLPAILNGEQAPASPADCAVYASLCQKKRLYASATRLYREAITAQPSLAPPGSGLLYGAACAAAQASQGAGRDAAGLSESERAGLRQQARDWLRAELGAWRGQLDKQPAKARAAVAMQMRHWLRDPDFACVRGAAALAKLPAAERPAWQQLWEEVEALRRRASGPAADARPQAREGSPRPSSRSAVSPRRPC
jgi:tetratricopeptide (TPR) repeat protein